MIRVYIASPYTIGDQEENVKRSIAVASGLIDAGFNPHIPLLNHYVHSRYPKSYDTWIRLGIGWIISCDCVLRLPGESAGADAEVKFAEENNIPVFTSITQLKTYG